MESPTARRVPQVRTNAPVIDPLHLPAPAPAPMPMPMPVPADPFGGPGPMQGVIYNGRQYRHLPPGLAQQVAALGQGFPIFAPPPAPVNFNRYEHLPPVLHNQVAAFGLGPQILAPPPTPVGVNQNAHAPQQAAPPPPRRGRQRRVPLVVPEVSIFICHIHFQ